MSRRPAAAAGNARIVQDVVYDPDPHGVALFHNLAARINATLNGARPIAERADTFYGVGPEVQSFRGANGLGAARVYAQASPTMQDQISATDSNASAVFAGRMARSTQ